MRNCPTPRAALSFPHLEVPFEALLLQHTNRRGVKYLRQPDEPFQLRVARPAAEK